MEDHPQTRIIVYDQHNGCERSFYCDKKLSPILFRLNEFGATTIFSCQALNNKDVIQIGFDHSVPREILLHALTVISAAYPSRYIRISTNEYFDPIIYAYKSIDDMDTSQCVYKFDRTTGSPLCRQCYHWKIQNPQQGDKNDTRRI